MFTLGSRPTVLWIPQVQTGDASFGMPDHFDFIIPSTTNIAIVVEACTNLASAQWTSLHTCTVIDSLLYFCDEHATNHSARFYHVRAP